MSAPVSGHEVNLVKAVANRDHPVDHREVEDARVGRGRRETHPTSLVT
jgi:hypothetical protein